MCIISSVTAIVFARDAIEVSQGNIKEIEILLDDIDRSKKSRISIEDYSRKINQIIPEVRSYLDQEEGERNDTDDRDEVLYNLSVLYSQSQSIKEQIQNRYQDSIKTIREIRKENKPEDTGYQIFSGLLIRIGSIAIVMIIFGFALKELKKSIKRGEESRQLLMSITAMKDKRFSDRGIVEIRSSLHIDDSIKDINEKSVESFIQNKGLGFESFERIFNSLSRFKSGKVEDS